MQCYFCKNESVALCSYCYRGICHDHKKSGDLLVLKSPEIINNLEKQGFLPHSLWCGKCVTDYTYAIIKESIEINNADDNIIKNQTTTSIEKACSKCNSLNDAGDSYCKNCGTELESELI